MKTRKQVIDITNTAAKQIQKILENKKNNCLRIGVTKRGCSGLSYEMECTENKKNKFDEEINIENNTKVVIDASSVMYLLGCRLDYIEDFMKSEFIFDNPNKKGGCGCGESFNT